MFTCKAYLCKKSFWAQSSLCIRENLFHRNKRDVEFGRKPRVTLNKERRFILQKELNEHECTTKGEDGDKSVTLGIPDLCVLN